MDSEERFNYFGDNNEADTEVVTPKLSRQQIKLRAGISLASLVAFLGVSDCVMDHVGKTLLIEETRSAASSVAGGKACEVKEFGERNRLQFPSRPSVEYDCDGGRDVICERTAPAQAYQCRRITFRDRMLRMKKAVEEFREVYEESKKIHDALRGE